MFNFSVLDQKKSNEGGRWKKTFKKKNIEPIFGKVDEGDEIKKNIGQISWKVIEGAKVEKKKLIYLKKVHEGDEKNKQNNIAEKTFLSPEINLPKSYARAHLKLSKKHSGLTVGPMC